MTQAASTGRLSARAPRLATKSANLTNFALLTSLTRITPPAASQAPRLRPDGCLVVSGTLPTCATGSDLSDLPCSVGVAQSLSNRALTLGVAFRAFYGRSPRQASATCCGRRPGATKIG